MAFLMLLHEKMRLQRRVNRLTYEQLRASSRKDRVSKQITRIQKMFSTRQTRLQKQADIMRNQFKMNIYNMAGLGLQNQAWNPMGGGLSTFVLNTMGQMLYNGGKAITMGKDKNGNDITTTFSEDKYNSMMSAYMGGNLKPLYKEGSQTEITGYGPNGQFTQNDYQAFMQAMQMAQNYQSQAQMQCQNMEQQYSNNISIWLEQQETALEEAQDEALLPLQEQETEWELEEQSIETQLTYARERLKNIEQAVSEGIKDSAPKFGLG